MRKLTLLCLVMASFSAMAQTDKPSTDTSRRSTDSLVNEMKENVMDNIPTISIDESETGENNSQNVSSILTAARDPYYNAASFSFSSARYRVRGYDAELFSTYMNGIPMDNLDNGFTPFGLWGGLNDVMRNHDLSLGLRPNTFAFGDIGSTTNIDSRASKQRKQTSFGYALANRNYTHRFSLSHSSGLSKKGWAYTVAGSRRYADEGYVPGTYYNGWSYFVAVDKRFSSKNMLSLAVFGAPTESGRQNGATQEAQELTGSHYYNPYWGYQNGKKRNPYISKTHQPYIILTHDLKLNNNTSITTAAGYSFGDRGSSAIDWYNAADPRPDYYRNLPSYQDDPALAAAVAEKWRTDPTVSQLNWARLYDANMGNVETFKGVTGHRSHYIIEDRIVNTKRISFNSVINGRIGNHFDYTAGIVYQNQTNNYYKKVADLLGGDYYVDINQFAERDFPTDDTIVQNDINRPDRVLHKGDKFGYDYDIHIQRASSFIQGILKFNKFDFFGALEVSNTRFYRVGHTRTGLFPNNSFGKSAVNNFNNYAFKGGATYKLNGRNYFYVNGAVLTKAPLFDNVYISPRTRDLVQPNVQSENVQTIEYGYIHTSPKLRLRWTGYYTRFRHGVNVVSAYNEGVNTFVNYAYSNIDKNHFGTEFGLDLKLSQSLTFNGAAGMGRYYFSSRQNVNITADNTSRQIADVTIYSRNFKLPSTPHEGYTAGLTYRSPHFWFVSLTGNYFDQMFLDFNPIRRTVDAIDGLDLTKTEDYLKYSSLIYQTNYASQFTLDLFGSYSWRLPKSLSIKRPSTLALSLGLYNILDNKNIVTGGYEQLRLDNVEVNKFPPKLFYGYGRNYFLNIAYRF